jgi:hypothetical protein
MNSLFLPILLILSGLASPAFARSNAEEPSLKRHVTVKIQGDEAKALFEQFMKWGLPTQTCGEVESVYTPTMNCEKRSEAYACQFLIYKDGYIEADGPWCINPSMGVNNGR